VLLPRLAFLSSLFLLNGLLSAKFFGHLIPSKLKSEIYNLGLFETYLLFILLLFGFFGGIILVLVLGVSFSVFVVLVAAFIYYLYKELFGRYFEVYGRLNASRFKYAFGIFLIFVVDW